MFCILNSLSKNRMLSWCLGWMQLNTALEPLAATELHGIYTREGRERATHPERGTKIPTQKHWLSCILIMPEQQQKEELHEPLFSTCMRQKYVI